MAAWRPSWKDAAYLALGLILISALVLRAEPGEVAEAISGIGLPLLGLVLLFYLFNLCIKVLRWVLILIGMGARRPGLIAVPIFLASLALNNSTPGKVGGEPVRALLLKEHTGSRLSLGIASIFAEKAMDIMTILLFSGIGLVYLTLEIGFGDVRALIIGIAVGSMAILLLLLTVASRRFAGVLLNTSRSIVGKKGGGKIQSRAKKAMDRAEGSLSRFHDAVDLLVRNKSLLPLIVLLDLEIWLNEAARLYLVVLAIPTGADIAPLGALAATSIANILGFILPIGSGNVIGSSSVMEVITGDERISASASIVAVATSLWLSIPIGLLSLVILRRVPSRKEKAPPAGDEAGPGKERLL